MKRWAKLRDRQLLLDYMEERNVTQARLGRHADVSRQFVHMLTTGQKATCSPRVAELIEEALQVLPGTLFVFLESPTARPTVKVSAGSESSSTTGPRSRSPKSSSSARPRVVRRATAGKVA